MGKAINFANPVFPDGLAHRSATSGNLGLDGICDIAVKAGNSGPRKLRPTFIFDRPSKTPDPGNLELAKSK